MAKAGGDDTIAANPGDFIVLPKGQTNYTPGQVPVNPFTMQPMEYSSGGVAESAGTPVPKPGSDPTAVAQESPAQAKAGAGQQGPSKVDDALTMGLGMFFQQYLAPMLAMTSQTNMNEINQWGGAMNQALQNPLPPGVAQTMKAFLPQQQQLLGMLNQAQLQQSATTVPFQQLMSGLSGQTAATQALQDAFMKAATYQELGAGSPSSLAAVLSGALGGSGTLGGALAQLLGGGSGALVPSNPNVGAALGLGGAATANATAGAGYNPNAATPGA